MKRDERAVIKTMMRRRCVPSTRELITSAFDYIRLASLQGDSALEKQPRTEPASDEAEERRAPVAISVSLKGYFRMFFHSSFWNNYWKLSLKLMENLL